MYLLCFYTQDTLTLWHNDIKEIFHIDNTIMPHLIKDFTEDTQYTLSYNIQNDYLALKSNNKLYKIYTNNPTQSIQHSSNNTTQQNNADSIYLKESKDFENLKNILYPTSQQIYQEVKVYVGIRQCTQMFSLNKPQGRIVKIEIPKENVSDSIIANTESNQTRILKSWANTNQKITEQDIRIIALSTIDIINRKDMSKDSLIYKALDKIISDYQIYKDNFPQEYYVEFGRYMVESGIQENKGILYIRILETLTDCCKLIAKSRMFGEVEYKNGGVAIFHLYENYVSKFEGDENGLDKVSHFLFSALMAFRDNVIAANIASVGNEIVDYLSLNAKKAYNKLFNNKIENYGTGFDMSDIKANNAGISYGAELKERAIKGLFQ